MTASRLGESGAVVAELHRHDRVADCSGDLHVVTVTVRVDPDDGINYPCLRGHTAWRLSWVGAEVDPAWEEPPSNTTVTVTPSGDQASHQVCKVGLPGWRYRGQVSRRARIPWPDP